jgi:hypothetical protein
MKKSDEASTADPAIHVEDCVSHYVIRIRHDELGFDQIVSSAVGRSLLLLGVSRAAHFEVIAVISLNEAIDSEQFEAIFDGPDLVFKLTKLILSSAAPDPNVDTAFGFGAVPAVPLIDASESPENVISN